MDGKRVFAALWCLLLVFGGTRFADAHAYVVATSPAVNATANAPLGRVSVSFDEPVTLESATPLVVRDRSGAVTACAGGAHVNPDDATQVVCTFAAPLAQGAYTVAWRVTSADTHVVHGVFSFGVGLAVSERAGETSSAYDPSGILATLLRWLVLTSVVAIVGGIGLLQFVLRTPWYDAQAAPALEVLRRCCRTAIGGGVAVALPASVAALLVQAAAATGSDLVRALPQADEIMWGSTWGLMWVLRVIALALVAATFRRPGRAATAIGLIVAVILPLTLSLSGHALATGSLLNEALAVKADALHLIAAGLWGGGLFVLAAGTARARSAIASEARDPFVRTLVARFSSVAVASVAAIVITGTYGAVVHVGSWSALVSDGYGRVILAKIVLLAPLLVLGFLNSLRSRPNASGGGLAATVGVEAVLVALILVLSAVLTGQPLPHPPV